MHDLIRQLKQAAYYTADKERCDVEQTPEWRAAVELEAWRSVMPQYEFREQLARIAKRALDSTK